MKLYATPRFPSCSAVTAAYKTEARARSHRLAGMWRADLEHGMDLEILLNTESVGRAVGREQEIPQGSKGGVIESEKVTRPLSMEGTWN